MANIFKNASKANVSSTLEVLCQSPPNTTTNIHTFYITNTSNYTAFITIVFFDDSEGTNTRIISNLEIPPNWTYPLSRALTLESLDMIKVQASIDNTLDIFVSMIYITE